MRCLTPIVYPDGSQQSSAGAQVTSSVNPASPGASAAIGSSAEAARADHAHRDRITVSASAPGAPQSGDLWIVI